MKRAANISALLFIVWGLIYYLFGKTESATWNSIYYVVDSIFVLSFLQIIKHQVQFIRPWIFDLASIFLVIRIIFSLMFLIEENVATMANECTSLMIFFCVLIYLILIIKRNK